MKPFKYKAFISYSHADERWARWLHRALETYRVPKPVVDARSLPTNRINPVFRDREELGSAAHLSPTIKAALADSANLIVICSRNAAASDWVAREIEEFKDLGRGERIFCLLVDDPELSFPQAVLVDSDHDGAATVEETEPLAADARASADGKAAARLKIVAGLLDIGLSELTQRETQRRVRRITYIAAGAITGMAAAVALTLMTLLAQQETERQRENAEAQAQRTLTINRFLQELLASADPQGAGAGRDVTLREVLQHAKASIGARFADQPDIQADILHTLGTSYLHLAEYELAEELLNSALGLRVELFGEASVEVESALNELGRLYHEVGRLGEAEETYRQAARISARLHEEPHGGTAAVLNNLALLLRDRGKLDEAEPVFREALAMKRRLFGDVHEEVTPTLNNLGLLLGDRGDFTQARKLLTEALESNRALWGDEHALVGINLNNLAWVHLDLGEPRRAELVFREAIAIKRKSTGDAHPSTAISLSGLGVALEMQGEVEAGLALLEQALAVFESAYSPDHWRIAYTRSLIGRCQAKLGNTTLARELLQSSIAALDVVLGAGHRRTREAVESLEMVKREMVNKP